MNWLKQNWTKATMGTGVLLIGFSLVYYFMFMLPMKNLETKISDCRELGEEFRKTEIKENPTLSFVVPEFTFNKELNACLYKGGFVDSNFSHRYIVDLYTNKRVLSSAYFKEDLVDGVPTEEFNAKAEELFK